MYFFFIKIYICLLYLTPELPPGFRFDVAGITSKVSPFSKKKGEKSVPQILCQVVLLTTPISFDRLKRELNKKGMMFVMPFFISAMP